MNRRTLLIGGAAGGAVAAGFGGLILKTKQDISEWRAAAAALRRPLDSRLRGRDALTELVRAATLAANSHNTQAWRFAVGEATITVLPDFSRRTPVVDPDDHHLSASLGAAVENIVQAAPVFGLVATPRFDAQGDGRVVIDLHGGDTVTSAMAAAIVTRQCSRALYDGRAVAADAQRALAAAGNGEGVKLLLLTDRPAIDAVAELIIDGNSRQLNDPAFMAELKHWLRFSYAKALRTGDGLFSAASGNPPLPAPVGRMLFDVVMSADSENRKCRDQIASSAGLAVFVSARDDRAHWLASGRAYQRFALQASALGIRHAFLNQAVEVAPVRRRLAEQLAPGARPDLIVRFGYGPQMPPSLRRPVMEVLA
jgi:nitroreductase